MRGAATVAMLIDAALGEPPPAWHPTVWMGRGIAAGRTRRRAASPKGAFAEGALTVLGVAAVAATAARALESIVGGPLVAGLALKPALALRGLLDAGKAVERSLRAGRLEEARRQLSYHLVSRDTATLSASDVAGAAISSLAENASDSIVAPLLAYRVGGLAAAYAYRALNTANAMLGYRTPELEWFGKAAARTDDVVNWFPARATAALIAAAAPAAGGSMRAAWMAARHDAGRCPSPNGGWPMAAMAGALGVVLIKRGVYTLNDRGRAATPDDIARARRILVVSSVMATGLVELC